MEERMNSFKNSPTPRHHSAFSILLTCSDLPYYTDIILIRWAADGAAALQIKQMKMSCSSAYMVTLDGPPLPMFWADQDMGECSKSRAMPGLSRLLSGQVIWPSQALDSGTLSWLRTLAVWGWISFQHWHRKTLSNHSLTFRHILNINQSPRALGDNLLLH